MSTGLPRQWGTMYLYGSLSCEQWRLQSNGRLHCQFRNGPMLLQAWIWRQRSWAHGLYSWPVSTARSSGSKWPRRRCHHVSLCLWALSKWRHVFATCNFFHVQLIKEIHCLMMFHIHIDVSSHHQFLSF